MGESRCIQPTADGESLMNIKMKTLGLFITFMGLVPQYLMAAPTVGIVHGDYAELIREDQPAAWWRFDDGDETAKDASGHGHHGISRAGVTATEGLPGTKGKAVRFNGRSSYIEVVDRNGLDMHTLSVELWFRSTQAWGDRFWPGSATLISTATSGPGSADWLINAASQRGIDEGRLLAETGPKGKPQDLYLTSKAKDPLNDGHWHHVVLTRAENGDAKLYVDGAVHFSGNDGGGKVFSDRPINIGGEKVHPGGRFFEGDMDEVAIYPHVLSAERVKAHFEAIAKHLPPRPEKRLVKAVAPSPKSKAPEPEPEEIPLEPFSPLRERIANASAKHWAYQPLHKPTIPRVKQADRVVNPIDAFILARLEIARLIPAEPADVRTLLRRASFDLLGLPPDPKTVQSLLPWNDQIESLLASPHYGERYARHWLDVARYADSAGYELDNFYHHAWHYRDYVIRAFNADKPFDRFIREQIAGDLLEDTDKASRFATGFYTVGPLAEEGGIKRPRRLEYQRLTDAADTTGEAFLGMTFGCARCHDHKYDPITQRDYFALQAFFAASEIKDLPVEETKGKNAEAQRKGARMRILANRGSVPTTRLFTRGDYESPAGKVLPGFPDSLPGGGPCEENSGDDFQQRRILLADWITSPKHPLTARVIANRVWMWHFGRPLVDTPNDFGLQGEPPSHPELLDYLASYLIDRGWSLKDLHRHIMQSGTYRMSSKTSAKAARLDPGNQLYSRFPRRRLEAEAIWDNLLVTSGELNPTLFGPAVFPPIDPEVIKAMKNAKWKSPDQRSEWARRGIYVVIHRSLTYPFFETFNVGQPIVSCARRDATVVSPQALNLLNDRISTQLATAFADRLKRECGDDLDAIINRGWLLAFSRPITQTEREATQAYLEGDVNRIAEWCLALFNTNEFIYVD